MKNLWAGPAFLLVFFLFSESNLHATPAGCIAGSGLGSGTAPQPIFTPSLGIDHADECTLLNFPQYPPTSGTHFKNWSQFKIYSQPVTAGYWLHSMEHGAMVILYNCPLGCGADIATLSTFIQSLPLDTLCTHLPSSQVSRRVIMAPDPKAKATFSILAWTWSLEMDCLDTAAIHNFYTAHYAKTVENECGGGVDLTASHWCGEPILGISKRRQSENKNQSLDIQGAEVDFRNLKGQRLSKQKFHPNQIILSNANSNRRLISSSPRKDQLIVP